MNQIDSTYSRYEPNSRCIKVTFDEVLRAEQALIDSVKGKTRNDLRNEALRRKRAVGYKG